MHQQKKVSLHSIGPFLGKGMIAVGTCLFGIALVLIASASIAAPTTSPPPTSPPPLSSSLGPASAGLYGGAMTDTPAPVSVGSIVAQVIAVFFGLLGIIFVVLMVYGGFQWMTAAGNPEQVKKAQKLMLDAILGVLILMVASFISYWVLYTIAHSIVTTTS